MTQLDTNRALCMREDCVLANQCQRAIALRQVDVNEAFLVILNPANVTGQSDCPYQAHLATRKLAYGFKAALNHTFAYDKQKIYYELYAHFGKNPYYDRLNGKRPITPEEQNYIRETFARYGYPEMDFERYEDKQYWDSNA